MIKYHIYAIGNMKRSAESEIFIKYSKRISNIQLFEYVSHLPEGSKKTKDESEKLLSMIKNNGKRILLDQFGKCFSSDEFSNILSNWKNTGFNKINFIIGGADGVDQKLKDNVDLIISFSKMTFPHMLARVILLEQIYRAEAIIAKHPYHRN